MVFWACTAGSFQWLGVLDALQRAEMNRLAMLLNKRAC